MFLSVDGAPGSRLELGAKLHSIPQSPSLLTSSPCLTLQSSLLVLKFQYLLFVSCSSPFAWKRPGLGLSGSGTIPSSRSLSVRAASLAKPRAWEGKGPRAPEEWLGSQGSRQSWGAGRSSALYTRFGSLTQIRGYAPHLPLLPASS